MLPETLIIGLSNHWTLILPDEGYSRNTSCTLRRVWKIPKGQSESVYRRRTDNTMAKRKKYKRTNNDQQNTT